MADYDKRCASIKAWHDLRATVYARVYRRTDDHGKQALQEELDRIMGLVMSRQISIGYLPPLFGGPTDAHHPTISNKYRAVLFASDGTVVGLLDELRAIARQRPEIRRILHDLPALCSVWENQQAGCCPFWEQMTQDEQWEAVSALKNLVQALGPDADVFDNIHTSTIRAALEHCGVNGIAFRRRRERPPPLAERIALNRMLQGRAAALAPNIAHLEPTHPRVATHEEVTRQLRDEEEALEGQQHLHNIRRRMDALDYRSLSHRLLDQTLSSRKARIYGMV